MSGIEVEIAICPTCGTHVEWQGDYGWLCHGDAYNRHDELNAVPTKGVFVPAGGDPVATGDVQRLLRTLREGLEEIVYRSEEAPMEDLIDAGAIARRALVDPSVST